MAVLHEGTKAQKFIWRGTFGENGLAKAAKFRWDPTNRYWWTNDILNAAQLAEFCEDAALRDRLSSHVAALTAERESAIADSMARDADFDIPVPDGLEFRPFQRAGVKYAMDRRGVLIGDEMGLGKTIQAIGVINAMDAFRVLIICPASLKENWKREVEKWTYRDLDVGVAYGSDVPDTDVVIINFDIVKRNREILMEQQWDLQIIDEAHKLKNPKAQRTKAILGNDNKYNGAFVDPIKARKLLFLTGTPIDNRPLEFWPLLHRLDPVTWKSFFPYAKRYCGAYNNGFGWDFRGATNLEELQVKVRETVMVRRLKADVLGDLPNKQRQILEIKPNGTDSKLVAGDMADFEESVNALIEGKLAGFEEITHQRLDIGLAKAPYVAQHILDCLEAEDKLVVFTHHAEVMREIEAELAAADEDLDVVTVDGSMDVESRQFAVDEFQEDKNVRVFIGTMGACAVGFTLTAASHVIFAEEDWVPSTITQAEDRCHRIGQKNSVFIQHIVFENSIDAILAKTVIRKQEVLGAVLDDEIEVGPVVDIVPAPVLVRDEVSASTWSPEVTVTYEEISEDDVATIHEALKTLAGVCDGALALDGFGFNATDAGFGHDLAITHQLTERQAIAARTMIRKYARQLYENHGMDIRHLYSGRKFKEAKET